MIARRQEHEGWGRSVVERLAGDLQQEFPGVRGFSAQNLWYMRQFYLEYRDSEKLQPLVGEVSWSHNLIIMAQCKDPPEREFYLRMTRKFGWSRNVLIHRIENRSYEKTLPGQYRSVSGSFASPGRLFKTAAPVFSDAIVSALTEVRHCIPDDLRSRLANVRQAGVVGRCRSEHSIGDTVWRPILSRR